MQLGEYGLGSHGRVAAVAIACTLIATSGCGTTIDANDADGGERDATTYADAGRRDVQLDGRARDGGKGDGGTARDAARDARPTDGAMDAATDAEARDAGDAGMRPDAGDASVGVDAGDGGSPDAGCTMEICNGDDDDCDGEIDEGSGARSSCYTGDLDTRGIGACTDGVQACRAGSPSGACVGQVLPAAEACNGADDDCDGDADEGLGTLSCGVGACSETVLACSGGSLNTCTPGSPAAQESCGNNTDDDCDGTIDEGCDCVYVRPASAGCCNGGTCPGSQSQPLCSINEAITRATTAGGTDRVCVAAMPDGSGGCTLAEYDEAITMVPGLKLHGNFDPVSWTRGDRSCTTAIVDQTAAGVVFPDGTARGTEIDGFEIRAQSGVAGPTAGVTFEGSDGIVSNSTVEAADGGESYAVEVTKGGEPLITGDSRLQGGRDASMTAGLRCIESSPVVRGVANGDRPSVSGGSSATGTAFGVWANNCSGMRIEKAFVRGGSTETGRSAGVYFEGNNHGAIVRGSDINGGSTSDDGDAHGIWLADCAGAPPPWIVGNDAIRGGFNSSPGSRVFGVFAQADCHVAIERNARIEGGPEARSTRAIACADGARCVIQDNGEIIGSVFALEDAVGVYCGPGSCRDIRENDRIVGSRAQGRTTGIWLDRSGPVVEDNFIGGGCGPDESTGVRMNASYARLVNNVITGGDCSPDSATPTQLYGIRQMGGGNGDEPRIHSNTIDGGRFSGSCEGRAVEIQSGSSAAGPVGVYRNNIVHGGMCDDRWGLVEATRASDPRIVENNVFWEANQGHYVDEGGNALDTASAINGRMDVRIADNLVTAPMFVTPLSDVHLQSGSMCIDNGTSTGAPATDFDGEGRPAGSGFDIGADEE